MPESLETIPFSISRSELRVKQQQLEPNPEPLSWLTNTQPFGQLSVDSLWNAYVTWQEHTVSQATLRSKNNTRIASFIKAFVAFDKVVVFGIIHNQQCSGLLFFCFFMTSFFSHKRKGQLHVSFPSAALSRYPLSFYTSHTTLCNNTSYYVSKDDITQFHWMITSFHFPNAGLSEICVFLYTLGSLCSKSE